LLLMLLLLLPYDTIDDNESTDRGSTQIGPKDPNPIPNQPDSSPPKRQGLCCETHSQSKEFWFQATRLERSEYRTGREIADSQDAIAYLFLKYGNGKIPWTLQNPLVTQITSFIGLTLARLGAPATPPQVAPPELPVTLWAYEGSPFCGVVRQALDQMQLEHTVKYTPRGSPNRLLLMQENEGRFQVPCLQDPNTGVTMFESQAIVEYLTQAYGRTVAIKYM
jgi:hypothetical protein